MIVGERYMAGPFHRCFGLRAFLVLGLLGLVGCGPSVPRRYPQSGFIHFEDGTPVKTGTIEIGGAGAKWTASGEIQRDGSFKLSTVRPGDGAVAGEYQVVIRQIILAYLPAVGGHDHGHTVHAKYRDYRTSPLTLVVEKKANNHIRLVVEQEKP